MAQPTDPLVSSGITGLDDILRGGFPERCLYLVAGLPGTGKTTLAMQFLLDGVRAGERCLYISLSETKAEIDKVARSHGWDISALQMTELVPSESNLAPEAQLTVFNPAEMELGETTRALIAAVDTHRPQRLVVDSLSELRLIAQDSLRYRRQVLALKQFYAGRECTVLMLDDKTGGAEDDHLQSIAHGVISLEQLANQYGAERRRLRVSKMRGVAFRGGYHDFAIRRGGLDVFPRLVAAEHSAHFEDRSVPSDNEQVDALLCGGLPTGTSTLPLGPAGTGKSTLATQFATAAARRGDRAAMFVFDENIATLRSRSRKIGLPIEDALAQGQLTVQQVDPAELSSGEFATIVRRPAEGTDTSGKPARMIIVDSLNGYLNAVPEERFLTAQLHELLSYLGQRGVVTILTVTQTGLVGNMASPVDTTYLADNVILFRFFELGGCVRRAISVVKMRNGKHERTIREFDINERGILVGEPLAQFQGILTGVPTYAGKTEPLLDTADK
jgi:circadian clock protein KaiC